MRRDARGGTCGGAGVLEITLYSALSAVIATQLPGEGTIYMKQSIKFRAPLFVGDAFTARVEVLEYCNRRRITKLLTTCTGEDGTILADGEALVLAPKPAED
jgi:acyl dehydratase